MSVPGSAEKPVVPRVGEAAEIPGWSNLTEIQRADILAHVNGLTGDEETYDAPPHGWTCFHCGATLRTKGAARLHFGALPADDQRPICVVPGSILWPLTQAALAAEAAPWPVTTWAVSVEALEALLSHVERRPSVAREPQANTGHTNGNSGNTPDQDQRP